MKTPSQHEVNWDKVKTIKDIKLIMNAMNFIIYDNDENFESLKHLLKDVEDE